MQVLQTFAENRRRELEQRILEEKITGKEAAVQAWAVGRLESFAVYLKERHIADKEEGMACVRELFGQEVKKRQKIVKTGGRKSGTCISVSGGCFW